MPKTKVNPDTYYCWVIAHINSDYIKFLEYELEKYPEYAEVNSFIPTVKILKKQFKGQQIFEEVPMLFNYGFFRIPRKFAVHYRFLENMKKNITCIHSWVRDNQKTPKPNSSMGNTQNLEDGNILIATATSQEIARLVKASSNYSIHSADELTKLKPGDSITLKGYPWDGILAEIIEIDKVKKKVRVKIAMFDAHKEILVSFDNVFFTVYQNGGYDDSLSTEKSLELLSQTGTLDKIEFKQRKQE